MREGGIARRENVLCTGSTKSACNFIGITKTLYEIKLRMRRK